jgi:hypothetical protein
MPVRGWPQAARAKQENKARARDHRIERAETPAEEAERPLVRAQTQGRWFRYSTGIRASAAGTEPRHLESREPMGSHEAESPGDFPPRGAGSEEDQVRLLAKQARPVY